MSSRKKFQIRYASEMLGGTALWGEANDYAHAQWMRDQARAQFLSMSNRRLADSVTIEGS